MNINFFMYLMCNLKYFCKNYRFCIYTVVTGNNKKKKKKKKFNLFTSIKEVMFLMACIDRFVCKKLKSY